MEDNEKLKVIADYLTKKFNQQPGIFSVAYLGVPRKLIKYGSNTIISTWQCGAIVGIGRKIYFLEESSGSWFILNMKGTLGETGIQVPLQSRWLDSFIYALNELNKYIKSHGVPYYYEGTDVICGYELK